MRTHPLDRLLLFPHSEPLPTTGPSYTSDVAGTTTTDPVSPFSPPGPHGSLHRCPVPKTLPEFRSEDLSGSPRPVLVRVEERSNDTEFLRRPRETESKGSSGDCPT